MKLKVFFWGFWIDKYIADDACEKKKKDFADHNHHTNSRVYCRLFVCLFGVISDKLQKTTTHSVRVLEIRVSRIIIIIIIFFVVVVVVVVGTLDFRQPSIEEKNRMENNRIITTTTTTTKKQMIAINHSTRIPKEKKMFLSFSFVRSFVLTSNNQNINNNTMC